jgi:taurine transport system substrate-binding protein
LAALKEGGVDPKSVKIVDMQPPDMLAAWLRGDIDAGFVWEPTLAKMVEAGGRVLLESGELAAKGYITGYIGFVRNGFAERYPDLVVAYLENQIRAVEFYRTNPQEAAAAVARQFGIPEAEAARQMATLVLLNGEEHLGPAYFGTVAAPGKLAEIFKDTADFLVSQGLIREAPRVETFRNAIDPSFLESATANVKSR